MITAIYCNENLNCNFPILVQETIERDKIMNDNRTITPAAFVSFKSRWGAAVCAQTQQSSNPLIWLTERAPEPRDVYWDNLSIPYVELALRRFLMGVALFFLTVFCMIPVAFVQSLVNIEGIVKVLPFMRRVIERSVHFSNHFNIFLSSRCFRTKVIYIRPLRN